MSYVKSILERGSAASAHEHYGRIVKFFSQPGMKYLLHILLDQGLSISPSNNHEDNIYRLYSLSDEEREKIIIMAEDLLGGKIIDEGPTRH